MAIKPVFKVTQRTITTTAVELPENTQFSGRHWIKVKNQHVSAQVFVGHDNTVTASNGWLLNPGQETPEMYINDSQKVWVISDTADTPVGVMEMRL